MNSLREYRKKIGLTQIEAANLIGVSRRTYQKYELENEYFTKGEEALKLLKEKAFNCDGQSVLPLKKIIQISRHILKKYEEIECAYLFGSYSRREATPESDVDIVVVAKPLGLKFFGIASELQEALGKQVDLLSHEQITDNANFLARFLNDAIRIC